MATFSSLLAAEVRAKAKTADGTWLEAHSCYATGTNTPAVRFIRPMTNSASPQNGAWIETSDDAVV